jgi:hypothetical protein
MSDLPSQAGERKFAAHNVIAVYPDVEQARAALTTLERKGIEAGNIELLGPGMDDAHEPQTNREVHDADQAVVAQVEKRGGAGFVVGAIVGALVLAAVAAIARYAFGAFEDSFGGLLIGAMIGGAAIGGFAGFFYGGATGLPVNDAWGETYLAVRGGKTAVAVHSEEPDQVETAIAALRTTGAEKVARFGPDGRTTPA